MISGRKYVRAAVFCGLFVLVTGGLLFQKMPGEAAAQGKSDAAPGTSGAAQVECYESIKDATIHITTKGRVKIAAIISLFINIRPEMIMRKMKNQNLIIIHLISLKKSSAK